LYGVLYRFFDKKPAEPSTAGLPTLSTMPGQAPAPIFRRALVAVHQTVQDASLLSYAGMLARQGAIGELHLVHVLPIPQEKTDSAGAAAEEATNKMLAALKAETGRQLGKLPESLMTHHTILRGPLVDQLLQYAVSEQIDVVLLGHRQDHPLRRSLARRLTKLAPCSVWLVPEGSKSAVKRVLVPIDFSPLSASALAVAARFATMAGLREVTALHVYFDESRTSYEGADEVIRGDETEHFNAFVSKIDASGVKIEPLFREGVHPAHTIRQVAQEQSMDLIVMETRGRTRSAAVLLGSVAQETLVESTTPVLVVKTSGPQVGLLRALVTTLLRSDPGEIFD